MTISLQKIGELGTNWKRWRNSGQYPNEIKPGMLYVRYRSNNVSGAGIVSSIAPDRGDLTSSEVWVTNPPPR